MKFMQIIGGGIVIAAINLAPAFADPPTRASNEAAFAANLSIASASPAWSRCGGTSDTDDLKALIPILVCYGKTDGRSAEVASAALDGLALKAMFADNDIVWDTRKQFAVMQIYAGTDRLKALHRDEYVIADIKYAGGPLPEEQTLYYDMLSADMRNVLLAHGGTRADNRDARPAQWKSNGPGVDLWVYKTGGATVQTYVFTKDKLTQTLKP